MSDKSSVFREPEVLSTMATVVNKLKQHITPQVPGYVSLNFKKY